ncbi:MAG: extracellular solute-binding protein [Spirochaetia bacterium]
MKKKLLWLLLALCISCGAAKNDHVNLYIWSYYIPDYILDGFTRETGIRVNYDTYDSNEAMYAKLASGHANFDIAVPSGDFVSIMINQGMLQKVDKDNIENMDGIDPAIQNFIGYDPGYQYSVPYFMGASGISVNTQEVKDYHESWSIFENPVYRNRMTMLNDMRETFGAALKFLGYSVNSINQEELQAAKAQILSWKKNLLKFDAETFGKDFAANNVYISQGYSEVILKELDPQQIQNYAFVLPKEGGPMYMDSFVILKNAKNVENAHALINYVLRPENYAKIADEFFYPSLIPAAQTLRKKQPYYTIEDLLKKNFEFKNDLGEAVQVYNRLWEEVLQN